MAPCRSAAFTCRATTAFSRVSSASRSAAERPGVSARAGRWSTRTRTTPSSTPTRCRRPEGSLASGALDALEARRPDRHPITPGALRGVERLVRGLEELLPVLACLRKGRDADRAGHVERAVLGDEGRGRELLPHTPPEQLGALWIGLLAHDHELFAPETTDRIRLAFGAPQRLGEADDDAVTHVVPVAIVHLLEVIEVTDEHAERLAKALGSTQLVTRHLDQGAFVEQPSESVGRGQLFEPLDHARVGQRHGYVSRQHLQDQPHVRAETTGLV